MRADRLFSFLAFALGVLMPAEVALSETVGEVHIRDVIPLDAGQRERLAAIVREDKEAAALFQARQGAVASLLKTNPRPLTVIHYEGLVNTDSRRVEDVKHLADMETLACLFEVWQVTPGQELSDKIQEFILAWAKTYLPTGNDVNENKLLPALVAYESLRDRFSEEDRALVDAWILQIGELHMQEVKRSQAPRTNRDTKRLRIITAIARVTGNKGWLAEVWRNYKKFVELGLYPDGTSADFIQRDTLTYHASALRPLLDLAAFASDEDLYSWESPTGSSVRKSVEFVIPYANGTKQHKEWVNTTVALDRKRAAAGLEEYRPGRLFDPKDSIPMFEQAARFDPSLVQLLIQLSANGSQRFPTWKCVLNSSAVGE